MAPPTSALYPSSMTTVSIPNTAGGTPLIGANPQRSGMMITNRGGQIITIAPTGSVPVAGAAGAGFDIAAGASIFIGGNVAFPGTASIPFNWTTGILAISAGANSVVTVMEF